MSLEVATVVLFGLIAALMMSCDDTELTLDRRTDSYHRRRQVIEWQAAKLLRIQLDFSKRRSHQQKKMPGIDW